MDLQLEDKVILITGAGDGMGLATLRALAHNEGAKVAGFDLDAGKVRDLGTEERIMARDGDLTVDRDVRSWVDEVVARWGRIDGLANFAGIYPTADGFLNVTDEQWLKVYDVNVVGHARACRAVIPHLVAGGGGSIVIVASDAGVIPEVPLMSSYSTSKAASRMLARCIAREFAGQAVRCNVLVPGSTRTYRVFDQPGSFGDQLAEEFGMERDEAIAHFAKNVRKIPLGRLAAPEDSADAALFLLSERTKHVTGSEFRVDGGVLAFV